MITETFGDMLYCPECECLQELPSPEELKYRIIISTKPPKEYLKAESGKDKGNKSQRDKDSDDDTWGKEPLDPVSDQEDGDVVCWEMKVSTFHSQLHIKWIASIQGDNFCSCCLVYLQSDTGTSEDSDNESQQPGVLAYKRLIAIHAGKPKGGLKEALKVDPNKVRRLSLSEQALEKASENHGTDVIR